MQHIEFRTICQEFGDGDWLEAVVPYVGGTSLPELLRRVELASAARDGQADLAGDYAGLSDEELRWPSRHYLGEPVLSWFDEGETVLLGCPCGEWGCWPFTAMVSVEQHQVVWSGYRHGHRNWDYSQLSDLVFDRAQYEDAVRATAR